VSVNSSPVQVFRRPKWLRQTGRIKCDSVAEFMRFCRPKAFRLCSSAFVGSALHVRYATSSPEDIDNKVTAPWTNEQISSLRAYQRSDNHTPFVCEENQVFEVGTQRLVCFRCRKEHLLNSAPMQFWAYDWNLD